MTVPDHLAVEMMASYPHATVHPIHVADPVWWALESRLALILLGRTHVSSAVHTQVIAELGDGGGQRKLDALRRTAERSRDALDAGDLTVRAARSPCCADRPRPRSAP